MSEKIDDGGPAFPVPMIPIDRDGGMTEVRFTGATLLDYFAGQALAGLCADPEFDPGDDFGDAAEWVYDFAKAMIAERNRLMEGKP